jgi:hypothetical protein
MGQLALICYNDDERRDAGKERMSQGRKEPVRALSADESSELARLSRAYRASAVQAARATEPSAAGARPGGPGRRFRREGKAARQERVSAEIARGYGLESDPDDPLPF